MINPFMVIAKGTAIIVFAGFVGVTELRNNLHKLRASSMDQRALERPKLCKRLPKKLTAYKHTLHLEDDCYYNFFAAAQDQSICESLVDDNQKHQSEIRNKCLNYLKTNI